MKYPNKKQIDDLLNSMSDDDFSVLIPEDATDVEKIKFELCKNFIVYLREHKMTQVELANLLAIDKSRINWIVKYRIEHFSIDYLYSLLKQLNPKIELKILPAA
jgi:predicted XRE-type DNA-binding protein